MNNDFERMNQPPQPPNHPRPSIAIAMGDDEEDWEAGDDDMIPPKVLRPSAPAFVPKPPILAPPIGRSKGSGQTEEDEWNGPKRPVTNRQLWDTANKGPIPMLSPSPTYGTLPTSQVKILRREPSSQPKKSPGPNVQAQKTLTEREEQYRLARERIFGKEPSSSPTSAASTTSDVHTGRGGSGGGSARASPIGNGGGMGKSSPVEDAFRLVPSQVRRSPAGSREGTPVGAGQRKKEEGKGVLRQPKGPGEGGGFGR